jgi:glycosyltransferase involved in cell wall biosynthesis
VTFCFQAMSDTVEMIKSYRTNSGMDKLQEQSRIKANPLVSVLIPTFNRPHYLSTALASVLQQSYRNLEIIVVNDGGTDVSDLVNSFDCSRLIFINRKENHGKAFSLNEALNRASGKYIAYLDDDDLYYHDHIESLVNALENETDCQVAYTDLYKSYCNVLPDGSRQVLSKVVEVSRDFDRFFMLYYNHVLHVSLMHHRDLIEKTGYYNEKLNILIDWDMTRRLVFFSDFHHVPKITGEFYNPCGDCDRISVQRRKDKSEYLRNVLEIRTTRPVKPWPKLKDMSIIFVTDRLDKQAGKTIGSIWRYTFYPYKLYLPLPQSDLIRLKTDMPNVVLVPVSAYSSITERVDAALRSADGDCIAIVPSGFPISDMWVEESVYVLINSSASHVAFELKGTTDVLWAVVLRKEDLYHARRSFPSLSIRQSLQASGIVQKKPGIEETPFEFDGLLREAISSQNDGNWRQAGRMFEYIAEHHKNELWMRSLAAKAIFEAGDHARADRLIHEVNQQRPTVETLLLQAKFCRENKSFYRAIQLLEKAQQILTNEIDYFSGSKVVNYSQQVGTSECKER